MTTDTRWPEGWTEVERPSSLYRRFESAVYPEARAFLELFIGTLTGAPRTINIERPWR